MKSFSTFPSITDKLFDPSLPKPVWFSRYRTRLPFDDICAVLASSEAAMIKTCYPLIESKLCFQSLSPWRREVVMSIGVGSIADVQRDYRRMRNMVLITGSLRGGAVSACGRGWCVCWGIRLSGFSDCKQQYRAMHQRFARWQAREAAKLLILPAAVRPAAVPVKSP
jgi:hypothetical protein